MYICPLIKEIATEVINKTDYFSTDLLNFALIRKLKYKIFVYFAGELTY